MAVYPAASLVIYMLPDKPKYYIDPKAFPVGGISNLNVIKKTAGDGVPELVEQLMKGS
jgi:hypothetical protein